jgi:hypothetical protein
VHRSLVALSILALLLVSIAGSPQAVASGGGTLQSLALVGSGGFTATADGTGDPSTDELAPSSAVDQLVPHTGTSAARVPADHVPTPDGNAVTSVNPGASGFNGISHRDQRRADNGNAFSLEPPDQALCVGNGVVLESVNLAVRAFSTTGAPLTATQSLNTFFGLSPAVIRSNPPVFGTFVSDPKCYFDAGLGRWFLTVLGIDRNPSGGAFTGKTEIYLAVSKTGSPVTGGWTIYKLDTTDDGTNGTPSHSGCPCLGDQPLIGADATGFYISTNEFPLFTNGFNGAEIYAMSKAALAAGTLPTVVHFHEPTLAEGFAYSVQPATTPPGGTYATGNGGTEYFLSALDFNGTLDDRIAVWAMTNTSSLTKKNPTVSLTNAVIDSQVYGQPPDAQQRPGATPLGDLVNGKLEFLAGNDDRMNQTVWAAGVLWGAVNTVVKTPNGPTRVGIAWFAVTPSVDGSGQVGGTVARQGYVSVNQESVMYPSIGVNAAGGAVMTFTLVGPDFYPSAAYTVIGAAGAGDVHILGAGAGPEDGFTGYTAFGGTRTARWGDYSAAVAAADGSIWTAVEFIPGTPRTINANWGTFIGHVVP